MAFGDYALVRDDFNRANENPLAGSWTNRILSTGTDLQIASAVAAATNQPGAMSTAWFTAFTPEANMEAYVTYTTLSGAGSPLAVWGRIANPGGAAPDGYYVGVTGGGSWTLNRFDDGALSVLATVAGGVSAGDKVGLQLSGPELSGWRYTGGSWSRILSVIDTTYTAAGYAGIGMTGATGRMDDFAVGTISVATSPAPPLAGRARW